MHRHARDSSVWPFASVISVGRYADPRLRQLITGFKYESLSCLEESWSGVLRRFRAEFLDQWPWTGLDALIVVPLPGDPRRIRERGFDHTAMLARIVQRTLVPWARLERALERTRSSAVPNAALPTDAARWANVKGVFRACAPVTTPVLLVDDVLTTGASLVTAAAALREAGASFVYAFTLAQAT